MSRPDPDPVARFLGFDPEAGLASVKLPEEPAPRLIQVAPQVAEAPPVHTPPPVALAGMSSITLRAALEGNPRQVLLLACKAIFRQVVPDRRGFLPSGGRFGELKKATGWALREIAGDPEFRTEIRISGWIVGKADDKHK